MRDARVAGRVHWVPSTRGYLWAYWPEHPLANSRVVRQHWHEFWIAHGKAAWVIGAKKIGAMLHHKNGVRNDNRIENLELCWPGRHPRGWTNEAMIEALRMQGYFVLLPNPAEYVIP